MCSYLFLQGPHGPFFRELGQVLARAGHRVMRVNLCGGDWADWPDGLCYHGRNSDWSAWVAALMEREGTTDVLMYGDWRPHHRETVHLARLRGIRVWAFDEGYLRPDWITMEPGGVNGNSTLPHTPEGIHELAAIDTPEEARHFENPILKRQVRGFLYAAYSVLGFPFFPFYRTHRPYGHLKEMTFGWIPHIFLHGRQHRRSDTVLPHLTDRPYYLFPLQLDSDSQVRRYSPFSGMREAIAYVMTSFARSAPEGTALVIRNHPLDSGLIRYDRFIRSFSRACGIGDRVLCVETGNGTAMLRRSLAVVLLNSTMGIQALEQGKPVFCVGTAVYAMAGLAENAGEDSLDHFWNSHRRPDMGLVRDFRKAVHRHALVNGNFYYGEGRKAAVQGCAARLMAAAALDAPSAGYQARCRTGSLE